MSITVRVPTPLRRLTDNQPSVEVNASTVIEAIDHLESQFEGIKERLVDESGEIRRFINVYVNDEDIRFLNGKDTTLNSGDSISIVPAIAGGTPIESIGVGCKSQKLNHRGKRKYTADPKVARETSVSVVKRR